MKWVSKAKWRDMLYWLKLKWKDNLLQMVKEKKQVEKEN